MKALLDMPVSALLLYVLDAHGHEGVHACVVDRKRIRITRLPLERKL
jgi:hypothetical protein